jgi:hypothetical protein
MSYQAVLQQGITNINTIGIIKLAYCRVHQLVQLYVENPNTKYQRQWFSKLRKLNRTIVTGTFAGINWAAGLLILLNRPNRRGMITPLLHSELMSVSRFVYSKTERHSTMLPVQI